MMGIGLFLMVFFWGALIVGGIWFVKIVFTSNRQTFIGNSTNGQLTPQEILDQRYARGEITREEYEQIKADLT